MPDQTGKAQADAQGQTAPNQTAPNQTTPNQTAPNQTARPLTQDGAMPAVPADRAPPPQQPQPPEQPAEPRRSSRRLWMGALILLALIGAALYLRPWATKETAVPVETVQPGPLTRVLAVNGTVAALNSVSVRAPVTGKLVALKADVGERFAVGDVLAEVDASQQQAVLRSAQAALDTGTLAQEQADTALKRSLALGSNVSRNALEDAELALQRARQEVGRLQALVDQARIELAKYSITAPISGTILTRGVDPGQLVDGTSALFTLADLSHLVVVTNVDETYATQIATGQPAVLQFVGETQTLPGKVLFVAPQVDVATGGLEVKIDFDTPQKVPVGLTVTANIIVDQQTAAISAPRAAILSDATSASVFLVKDGIARQQPVSVIDWPADRLQVGSGLAAGDVLILDASGLTDGMAVTPLEN